MNVRLMHIEDWTVPRAFENFCDVFGLTIEVFERDPDLRQTRYCAHFKQLVSVQSDPPGFLSTVHGNGWTQREALDDLIKEVTGKTLVFRHDGQELRMKVPA